MRRVRDEPVCVEGLDDGMIFVKEPIDDSEVAHTYEGEDPLLRFIREALWYHTRHPHAAARVDQKRHRPLERYCQKYRKNLRNEAVFFPKSESGDVRVHWKHALLFAARINDRGLISRALTKTDTEFETFIEERIEALATSR